MNEKNIYILWDDSHIWGLMAMRAARALDLPCRLVKSKEIAQGALLGKHPGPAALISPGGSARQKADALGAAGRRALRAWVASGGFYLGFCGGAGLALSGAEPPGLDLCPWPRASYRQRLYHLLTGHVTARLDTGGLMSLPVWWPGRFAPASGNVRVLASYAAPGKDLWLADLPLSRLPANVLETWRREQLFMPEVDFPPDLPLVVCGKFGEGQYLLSYAHLETPASAGANAWLGELLGDLAGIEAKKGPVPQWDTTSTSANRPGNPLAWAHASLAKLMDTAGELRIFFRRTPWLLGWRSGISGMACNNLLAALSVGAQLEPTDPAMALWEKAGADFRKDFENFLGCAQEFFWTSCLKSTLEPYMPDKFGQILASGNARLLGHPMFGGAMAQRLLDFVEEFIFLAQPE